MSMSSAAMVRFISLRTALMVGRSMVMEVIVSRVVLAMSIFLRTAGAGYKLFVMMARSTTRRMVLTAGYSMVTVQPILCRPVMPGAASQQFRIG